MRACNSTHIFTIALFASAWGMPGLAQQLGSAPGGRGGGPQPAVGSMPSRRFEKIADGVYYATSTGSMERSPR